MADYCARTGKEHDERSWYVLGRKDDGSLAVRCGNCLSVRYVQGEWGEGGPDLVRAALKAEAVSAQKG